MFKCPVCPFRTPDRTLSKCPKCGERLVSRTAKRRTVIQQHKYRLVQLVGEIREWHGKAVTAQQAAVKTALVVGEKLRLAHRLLARLRTKLKKRGGEAPPTWEEWVKTNLKFSVRTAYYYMELENDLDNPRASIRRLIRSLHKNLPEEDGSAPARQADTQDGGDKPTEYEAALQDLRQYFRDAVKTWPEEVVIYLTRELTDFDKLLDAIPAQVEPFAGLWLRSQDGGDNSNQRDDDQNWEEEAEARMRRHESFVMKAWRKFRDRADLTAYQKAKLVEWVDGGEALTREDRKRLAELAPEALAEKKEADRREAQRREAREARRLRRRRRRRSA